MFGYLRPAEAELLVKERDLYRALYCGLCRTMRKHVSFFAALSLNYDFVFLAVLRAELTGETFHFCTKRCPVHPLRRRSCAKTDSEALRFTAKVHLALTYEKISDDLKDADTPFFRRVLFFLLKPLISVSVRRMCKKDPDFSSILAYSAESCEKIWEAEARGERDLDLLASLCAEGLSGACAIGLSGDRERLMRQAAALVGRLIYLIDACDDAVKDEKKGSFNAFLARYGSAREFYRHSEEVSVALGLYAADLHRTVDLIAKPSRYGGICENITTRGIPAVIRRVTDPNTKTASKERKHRR